MADDTKILIEYRDILIEYRDTEPPVDWMKPIQLRNGQKAAYAPFADSKGTVVFVQDPENKLWTSYSYGWTGRMTAEGTDPLDVINVPKPLEAGRKAQP